jgi:hypothetical protein
VSEVLGVLSDWRDLIAKPPADLQFDKGILVQTRNKIKDVLDMVKSIDKRKRRP